MSRAIFVAVALLVAESASAWPWYRSPSPAEDPPPKPLKNGPLEVTREFYKALHAGDAAKAAKLAVGDAKPALSAYVRLARAHRQLEEAVAKKFGQEEAALVGYGNKVQSEVKALLGATEEIDGDEARVTGEDGRILAALRKIGGRWKVELQDSISTEAGKRRIAKGAAATESEARRVMAGVRAGRYPDAESAVRDFQLRVAKATGEPEVDDGGAAL
jgi:hypothetical protein